MYALGLLNALYCLAGILYFSAMISLHWQKWLSNVSRTDWVIFALLSMICLSLVSFIGYLGVRLMKKDETILKTLTVLFAAEIAYFIADVILFWRILPSSMDAITFGIWEVAEDAMVPQLLTGYPLIGIIVCFVLLRKSPLLLKR
jgi:hypothetical protein